jgi:hypothetical protein
MMIWPVLLPLVLNKRKVLPMKPYLILLFSLITLPTFAQLSDSLLAPLLQPPRSYSATKTTQKITIDGKDNETAWSKAAWSETFVDIEGKTGQEDPYKTRYKLLWDDNFLYVYVKMKEEHIWAKLKEHDQKIYLDNALEIFMDPDGDAHQYMEFEINAYGTVWDLMMTKPYRNRGQSVSGWDIKSLKKAVVIDGTLNDPSDKDKSWSVELAFPLSSLNLGDGKPAISRKRWRMTVARVQYQMDVKNGVYEYKKAPSGKDLSPAYYVWTPQGLVSLHYPERFGYVTFNNGQANGANDIANAELDRLRLVLWKYYYLQQDFKKRNGKYASTLVDLKSDFPAVTFHDTPEILLSATPLQYTMQVEAKSSGKRLSIDQEGRLQEVSSNPLSEKER